MKTQDLKNQIKELSEQQKVLKPQRKTVNFKGERIMDPWEAKYKVQNNKIVLKHLFITYAILRNKDIYKTISKNTEYSKKAVEKYVEMYGEVVCVGEE